MTIHWIGDSTVQYNDITTWPQCGMGQALQLYLRPEVQVANYARNGRSTVSFRSEGLWQAAANALRPGDILLIQFGHNDEKLEDPARGAGPEQYAANLLAYASESINAGALPVIVTPLTRRQFGPDGKLCATHGVYPDAARAMAQRQGLPCIDLTAASRQLVQTLGEVRSRELYMVLPAETYPAYPDGLIDNTHLRYTGAVAFAGLVAARLWNLGEPYRSICLPLPELYATPPALWPDLKGGRE